MGSHEVIVLSLPLPMANIRFFAPRAAPSLVTASSDYSQLICD
jgi:hypothetical protein